MTEQTGILPAEVGEGKPFAGTAIVSMNCWGFSPEIFAKLDERFRAFLGQALVETPAKAEFYLPGAVSDLIACGEIGVKVLPTSSNWFGVTYREDKPRVVKALAGLVNTGVYPQKLWA